MDLILKLLGVVLLLLVCVVIAGWIAVKYWWRRMAAAGAMPTEIKLQENPDPKWTRDHPIQLKFQAFADLGYEPTKVFLPTPQQIELQCFATSDRKRRAAIYRTVRGFNEEFTADTLNGISINATNYKHSDKFTQKTHKIIAAMPGVSIPELHRKFESLLENEELLEVPDHSLAGHIEAQYHKSMNQAYVSGEIPMWEDSFGDYSKRWANKAGTDVLREAFTNGVAQQLTLLTTEAGVTLQESDRITAKQWSTYQHTFLLSNPRIDRAGFGKYLAEMLYLADEDDLKKLDAITQSATDSQQIIEQAAIRFPQFKIAELVTIDQPFPATVYGYERQEME